MWPACGLATVLTALSFLSGCAVDPVPSGTRFVVSAATAPIYKNGPAQDPSFQVASLQTNLTGRDFGPDAQLAKGAAVTMIQREIGFSKVVTDEGVVGYVANDQIQRAPVITRLPAETPATLRENRPVRRTKPQWQPREEQLDLSDVPLPLPS